MKSEHIDQI